MEHLQKYFTMKTFDYVEQHFTDDQLDNFLVTSEGYRQHHKLLV